MLIIPSIKRTEFSERDLESAVAKPLLMGDARGVRLDATLYPWIY